MIAIIDYGMGNIHSVQKALEHFGAKSLVTNKAQDLKNCDKVILPGVGAFADAMSELQKEKLIFALKEHINNKKKFLGICLGMQLLFESSQEAKDTQGLCILKGKVAKFQTNNGIKVPHIGWNQLKKVKSPCLSGRQEKSPPQSRHKTLATRQSIMAGLAGPPIILAEKVKNECPLLKEIPDNAYVYFCHSYYPKPQDERIIATTTDYGIDFTSVVWKDNIYGVQFHPEKSQEIGLKILKNFIDL